MFGHVEPNGHVEPKGHVETLFKILKYGLVMLDPMVMLNFLVGCVLDWLCWTQWSCWTLFQDSKIWFGHVEPNGHVELSGCPCTVFSVLYLVLYCAEVQLAHQKYFAKTKFNMTGKVELKWSCWITLKYNGMNSNSSYESESSLINSNN